MTTRTKTTAVAFAILIGFVGAAHGQRTGSGGTLKDRGTAPKASKPKPPSTPTQKTPGPVKIITRYIEKPVTPTTGNLFVGAEVGAVILVEPLNVRKTQPQRGTVPEGKPGLFFNDLKPGNYRVAATLAGYYEAEKTVVVKKNVPDSIKLEFRAITYTVTIKTNVNGELKYGKKEDKTKSTRPIQNKSITLDLSEGDYEAEIDPGEPVYKSELKRFSVPEDTEIDFPLTRIEYSKETYSPKWTVVELRTWEVPSGWYASSFNLIVKGAGVALPRDESKRYYKDFELTADVKLVNGLGIGFALRAKDNKNYYLLELTGEKADEPLSVRLYIVKNGKQEPRIQANPIPGVAGAAVKSGEQFTVRIQVTNNRIAVDIDIEGTFYPLGSLTDANHTFAAGAVGIAARGNEESVVWRFHVCTECGKD